MIDDEQGDPVYGGAWDASAPSFEASGWDSAESQRTRFDVFLDMASFEGKRVLDIGCSRGDFAAYLIEKRAPIASYVGIDVIMPAILVAMGRGLERCEFYQADALDPGAVALHAPDLVCISGTLNTLDGPTALRILEAAWSATRGALIFNFLSSRAGPAARRHREGSAIKRQNTLALLDWSLSKTSRVEFGQDYFPNGEDATILMSR
jgi:SAM-dependent methyltransferase